MKNFNYPHLRWNQERSEDAERVNWYFVVVNRPDRIETILNRIYRELENVEIELQDEGKIRNEKEFRYHLISLKSRKGKINWQNIYKREDTEEKIIKDENLRKRTKEKNGLENYVARLLG